MLTKDPVCNVQIDEQGALKHKLSSDFDGQTFYFCCKDCKKSFDGNPHKFAPTIRWPEDFESEESELLTGA